MDPSISELDQQKLADQVIALMNSHFQRPTTEEKCKIIELAAGQIHSEMERLDMEEQEYSERPGFEALDQDQLAAQTVALINASTQLAGTEEATKVLDLAVEQIKAEAEQRDAEEQALLATNDVEALSSVL